MTNPESAARHSFVLITQNFLGNRKAENYQVLVENMLSKFRDLGVKMSIKVHYSGLHTDSGLRLRTGYDSVTDALSVPTAQRLP